MSKEEKQIQKTNELILKLYPELFFEDKDTKTIYTIERK